MNRKTELGQANENCWTCFINVLPNFVRDQHVRVNYLNVLPDKWIDYAWNPLQFPLDSPYDCDSIMHYRDSSFRSGLLGGGRTMEAVNPSR